MRNPNTWLTSAVFAAHRKTASGMARSAGKGVDDNVVISGQVEVDFPDVRIPVKAFHATGGLVQSPGAGSISSPLRK